MVQGVKEKTKDHKKVTSPLTRAMAETMMSSHTLKVRLQKVLGPRATIDLTNDKDG